MKPTIEETDGYRRRDKPWTTRFISKPEITFDSVVCLLIFFVSYFFLSVILEMVEESCFRKYSLTTIDISIYFSRVPHREQLDFPASLFWPRCSHLDLDHGPITRPPLTEHLLSQRHSGGSWRCQGEDKRTQDPHLLKETHTLTAVWMRNFYYELCKCRALL